MRECVLFNLAMSYRFTQSAAVGDRGGPGCVCCRGLLLSAQRGAESRPSRCRCEGCLSCTRALGVLDQTVQENTLHGLRPGLREAQTPPRCPIRRAPLALFVNAIDFAIPCFRTCCPRCRGQTKAIQPEQWRWLALTADAMAAPLAKRGPRRAHSRAYTYLCSQLVYPDQGPKGSDWS